MLREFNVERVYQGKRIDLFLQDILGESRSKIQKWIDEEFVKVNDQPVKKSYLLTEGDQIQIEIPEVEDDLLPEDFPLEIVYEEDTFLIVYKPPGVVVHPAPGHKSGTLVNRLLHHVSALSKGTHPLRPGIVHRLDKDTSGVLIVAKDDKTHEYFSHLFKKRQVTRKYKALVEGIVKRDMVISKALGRNPRDRKKIHVLEEGREALTEVKVLEYFEKHTLVQCTLYTGRTHQIRVHMASLGHPVVGDQVYGYKKKTLPVEHHLLHAYLLGFPHPITGEPMSFSKEIPDEFQKNINLLK